MKWVKVLVISGVLFLYATSAVYSALWVGMDTPPAAILLIVAGVVLSGFLVSYFVHFMADLKGISKKKGIKKKKE